MGDHTVKHAERTRAIGALTFEHRFVNLSWSYLAAVDQTTPAAPRIPGRGQSFWITPRVPLGSVPVAPPAGQVRASLEGLFRYDRLEPDRDSRGLKQRWIAGAAYWPRMRSASYSAAFMLDYERVTYEDFDPPRPTEKRLAVHMLVAF